MSDSQLVRSARAGSRAAAAELFERHYAGAWRAARAITGRREMADDVVQDAFERAFAALSRFDARRPFAPWLHRIVVNRSLDLVRAERRLVGGVEVDESLDPESRDAGAGDRALLTAIASLSPQRRVVVVLRYGLGYPPVEIAEMLALPVGTVHSRLARALEELRQSAREADGERA